jgi:hypothetical protein
MVRVQGDTDLVQVVGALDAVGRITHLLHSGQEKPDEHRDNRDDDEKLDQGKP